MIVLLRPGLTLPQARVGLASLARRLKSEYYADSPRWTLDMRPLPDDLVRDRRPIVPTVFAAVGLVLLIACANVANLLLARAGHRGRELAVRAALGAAPHRLHRQLLVETLMLGALGGIAGLAVAAGAVPLVGRATAVSFPQVDAPRIDVAVLAFACVAALASGVVFGAVPAWQLARSDLRIALGAESHGGTGRRVGHLIVVAEMAIAFAVLVGAGLLVRSFARVTEVNPGFDADGRVTIRVSLPVAHYRDAPQRAPFYGQLFDRLAAVPGVVAAGAVSELPLGGANDMGELRHCVGASHARRRCAARRPALSVRRGTFAAMNIRLAAGRVFDDRDGADAPRVAIVDEQAAAKYWPGRSAIGDRVNIDDDTNKTWRVIVGIVATVHHEELDGSRAARCTCRSIRPHRYLPSSTPTAMRWLLPPIRAAVVAIDPALPIYDVRPLDSRLAASLGRRRAATWLVGRLAALAVVLVSSVCTE